MGGKHKLLVHVTPFPVQPLSSTTNPPPPECLCGTNQFGVVEVLECPEEHLERESEPEDEGREDEHEFTGAHQHCVEHDQVDSHV